MTGQSSAALHRHRPGPQLPSHQGDDVGVCSERLTLHVERERLHADVSELHIHLLSRLMKFVADTTDLS